MHSGILRTSGYIHSLPLYLIEEVVVLITDLPLKLQEIHNVVSRNRIWLTRLASVGITSKKICEVIGLGGVLIDTRGLWSSRINNNEEITVMLTLINCQF